MEAICGWAWIFSGIAHFTQLTTIFYFILIAWIIGGQHDSAMSENCHLMYRNVLNS